MTEKNYKLNITSLEIKDPQDFSYSFSNAGQVKKISDNSSIGTLSNDNYFFEQVSSNQSLKEFGITKNIYHSQTIIKINSTGFVFPIWQLVSSVSESSIEKINIGRITLLITFLDTADNSGNNELLRLVSSNKSDIGSTSSLVNSSSLGSATANTIETNANLNKKKFYISGRSAVATATSSNTTSTSDTIKYTIDYNDYIISQNDGRYFTLGLETGSTVSNASLIKIESYVEIIN